jgi:hypothetical protein
MHFSFGVYSVACTLFSLRYFSSSNNSKDLKLFSIIEIDYADDYEKTSFSNQTKYYVLQKFTTLKL